MINKILFWNIRSVKTQSAFERLIDLHKRNKYSYIALMEPFQSPSELEEYRRRLGLTHAKSKFSDKIWIFWDEDWEETGNNTDSTQQLTMEYKLKGRTYVFKVTSVYAKCSHLERLELWEDLEGIGNNTHTHGLLWGGF